MPRIPEVAIAIGAGVAGTLVAALVSNAWLWPVLVATAVYPLFYAGVRDGRLGATVARMCVWALSVTATFWLVCAWRGLEAIGPDVIRGPAYADEMLHWVATGEGAEGSPAQFLPLHARHFGGFVIASALTGGAAGLVFGSILLDYMNFYVASLAAASTTPALAYLIGWPVWAIVRVIGFIAAGTAIAHLFVTRVLRRGTWDARGFRRWMLVSVALVLADVVLKWTLAEPWRHLLQSWAGVLG